jgi:hypothetical protein
MDKLMEIATSAWTFLAGLLIVVALLGALFFVLHGTAGAAVGGQKMAATAITGAIGLVILVLVAFLLIPQLGKILYETQPPPPFK